MHKRALALAFVSLSSQPVLASSSEGADSAYRAAKKSYLALKADAARRKRRDQWQSVARKFETVANKYPESPRAPESLFTAAQLLEDLSRISFVTEDLEASAADYRKLLDTHPRHRLADDGALALAKIQLERMSDPDGARKTLVHAIADLPKGDRSRALKTLLSSLPAEATKKSALVAKRPVVRSFENVPRLEAAAPTGAMQAEQEVASAEDVSNDDGEGPSVKAAPKLDAPAVRTVLDPKAEPMPKPPAMAQALPKAKDVKERLKQISKQSRAEFTLAEQLGLKVRRVVIDAGHGGHDGGAVGPNGTREKDVSLAVAKRLAEVLEAQGLEVVLTREDDSFVRLEDRAKIANEAKGDLFISVHCNSAASHSLHGIETYTLNTASDRYSIRLAARENSTTERRMGDLQLILADLATKANTDESSRLAARVQKTLVTKLSGKYKDVRDLGNKEALFYVLLGAKMPAILVETSFLSNPEEEKRLSTKIYQDDVARAIASGVQEFLGNRERVAKVD